MRLTCCVSGILADRKGGKRDTEPAADIEEKDRPGVVVECCREGPNEPVEEVKERKLDQKYAKPCHGYEYAAPFCYCEETLDVLRIDRNCAIGVVDSFDDVQIIEVVDKNTPGHSQRGGREQD